MAKALFVVDSPHEEQLPDMELLAHGHKEKVEKEGADYVDLIAGYHDLDPKELRRLLGL